jgi:hypothetical protein
LSRLDSFIRRLEAQRACLDAAAALIRDLPGPVLELGLGNGRTFDHLRDRLPDRALYAFDRQNNAHPDCQPAPGHLFLGEFSATIGEAVDRLGPTVALAHCDTGSGDVKATAAQAAWLGPALRPLLRPGAIVISDQPLSAEGFTALPLPEGVREGRYFFYRNG